MSLSSTATLAPVWNSCGVTGSESFLVLDPVNDLTRWRRERFHKIAEIGFEGTYSLLGPAFSTINLTRNPNGKHTLAPARAGSAGEPHAIAACETLTGVTIKPPVLRVVLDILASRPDGYVSAENVHGIAAAIGGSVTDPGLLDWPVEVKVMGPETLGEFHRCGIPAKYVRQADCHIITSCSPDDWPRGCVFIVAPQDTEITHENIRVVLYQPTQAHLRDIANRVRRFSSDVQNVMDEFFSQWGFAASYPVIQPMTQELYDLRALRSYMVVQGMEQGMNARRILNDLLVPLLPQDEREMLDWLILLFSPDGTMTDVWRGFHDAILEIAESNDRYRRPRIRSQCTNSGFIGRVA